MGAPKEEFQNVFLSRNLHLGEGAFGYSSVTNHCKNMKKAVDSDMAEHANHDKHETINPPA